MFKIFFRIGIGMFFTLPIVSFAEKMPKYESCIWISEVIPEAIIKIKNFNQEKWLVDLKADLIFKEKLIGELIMGEPNGYGSKWWSWEIIQGKSLKGGGRLVPFLGNYPARGSVLDKDYIVKSPRKVLFVGMGSNLYYTKEYRNKMELISAAEGFWRLGENCYFPGLLFNERHLGI